MGSPLVASVVEIIQMELTDMFQPEWGKVDVEFMAIVNLPPRRNSRPY